MLPATFKGPGVMIPIQLASRAAEHGTISLGAKSLGVALVNASIVFKLVICPLHERGNVIRRVVFMKDLRIGWIVGVGSRQCRVRHQQRIIKRAAYEVAE